MQKTVKYMLIGVAVLLALLLAGAAILAATFNPNDYKPQIIRLVQEKTHRTLTIPGNIKLSFFPKIGADLGKLAISAPDSNTEFASVEHAKVSLALLPLLSKRLVVDRVTIDGLRASVTRFKDGHTSVDDLIKPAGNGTGGGASTGGNAGSGSNAAAESGGPVTFDIDSVDINNARILFDDRAQERTVELAKLDLQTGRIADGVRSKLQLSGAIKSSKPEINATLNAKTGFMMALARKHYVLDGLDAQLKGSAAGFTDLVAKIAGDADLKPADKRFALNGIKLSISGKRAGQPVDIAFDVPQLAVDDTRVSGGKLSGSATLTESGRTIRVNFAAPAFEGSPQAFRLPNLALDATVKGGTLDAKANISGALAGDIDKLLLNSPQLTLALSGTQDGKALSGSLTTPMLADLHAQHIEFPKIAAGFTLPNPGGGTLQLKAGGNADLQLGKHTLAAALKGSLDESAFDAKFGMSSFSPAAYTFDIGIDKLDLDRYRSKPGSKPAAGTQAASVQAEKSGAKPAAKSADNSAEKPIDLSALKNLQASGNVRIGALKVTGIQASSVRFGVHAAGGKLDIDPLTASLYGGSASGALSAAASKPARFTLRQTLSGINLGPLLKDAIGKQPIEGKGNVRLDVATSGANVAQIRKDLNGSARLELRDGAVHGVNIAQTVRSAKARIGALRGQEAPQSGTASADEKTDFSEMSGSFRIVNGVAHNDDLNVKSPLVRVGGAGNIDLGAERIDYLAQVTVVSTLQGQGGPDLQALKGLTVPVRLSGPFSSIGWRVDFAGLANALAKQKLDEKKTELKSKAEEALGKEKGKLQEQLQDRLKGLFGK